MRFRSLPLVLSLAACAATSSQPSDEDAVSGVVDAEDALTSNGADPKYWPRTRELRTAAARPLALRACHGHVDGMWCGDALGGDAEPDTLVFCSEGRAWDIVHCACERQATIEAHDATGATIDMRADACVRRPGSDTATRTLLVSERDQTLRACQGDATYLEIPVSTGAPRYETREPMGMPASMREVEDFWIADKWVLKRMTSPFAARAYDLRIPFAQNLTYATPDGRTIRSLLYLHAWTDPRTGRDCPQCGHPNDPGPPGGRIYGYSAGCVNEPLDAARKLFMWAPQDTPVRIIGGGLPGNGSCDAR